MVGHHVRGGEPVHLRVYKVQVDVKAKVSLRGLRRASWRGAGLWSTGDGNEVATNWTGALVGKIHSHVLI